MREIKFRMKIKKDAKIWKVYAIDWYKLKALRSVSGSMEWISMEIIEQFLQYTGLKDKNGKEIYEGAIVRFLLSNGNKILEDVKAAVIFDTDYSWFSACVYKDNNDLWDRNILGEQTKYIEVIGNIHENPELLDD